MANEDCPTEQACSIHFQIQNGQCRLNDGNSHLTEEQGHVAVTKSSISTAAACKISLQVEIQKNPTLASAEWSGDARELCWMSAVPVGAYIGNGVAPFMCVTSQCQ